MLRFIYLLTVILKYTFFVLLMKLRLYGKPRHKVVKPFFEEAGGSFIKFGQLLALRVDVLPKEYSLEMLDLLDNVKPFPYTDVTEIFLQELGATPEKIFYDFQKEPFASGSFGQVHAAKLDKHTIVAVKIMRPNIEEMVQADFFVVDILAFLPTYPIELLVFLGKSLPKNSNVGPSKNLITISRQNTPRDCRQNFIKLTLLSYLTSMIDFRHVAS